jgi:hypothetical protein
MSVWSGPNTLNFCEVPARAGDLDGGQSGRRPSVGGGAPHLEAGWLRCRAVAWRSGSAEAPLEFWG